MVNGLEQDIADALILEDLLDHDCATDDETRGDRCLGEERQDRVATDIGAHDAAIFESAGACDSDEVFAEGGDC